MCIEETLYLTYHIPTKTKTYPTYPTYPTYHTYPNYPTYPTCIIPYIPYTLYTRYLISDYTHNIPTIYLTYT